MESIQILSMIPRLTFFAFFATSTTMEAIRPPKFRQTDYVRAVKAVRASGLSLTRSEITPDGRMVFIHASEPASPSNEFDAWKANRNASQTQGH